MNYFTYWLFWYIAFVLGGTLALFVGMGLCMLIYRVKNMVLEYFYNRRLKRICGVK